MITANKNKVFIIAVIAFIIIVLASACQKGAGIKQGQQAPDIKENALDGRTISLSDYKGKTVAVNFWGMWCGYCVEEMPSFSKAAQEYPDIVFLMVNTSNRLASEDVSEIRNFLKENNLSFENVLLNTKAAETYQVRSFPATFIIDKNGKISDSVVGAVNYETLINMIEKAAK